MSTFVESLKRLYEAGRIILAKIDTLLTETKLTQEEYDYIVAL